MVKQNDNSGNVIIGEAALSLAIEEKDINVSSLFNQLSHMARKENSVRRLLLINEARSLLVSFDPPEQVLTQIPYLQKLAELNEDLRH